MAFFQRSISRFEAALLRLIPWWIHPNAFTVVRGLLVVPVIALRFDPIASVALLIVSSACDILDGWLARKRMQVSAIGKIIDPVSDKVFVLGVLWFACGDRVSLPLRCAITTGEILLIAVRPVQVWRKVETAASAWGSAKTWIQSWGLAFVLTQSSLTLLAPFVLWAAVGIASVSFFGHVRRIFRQTAAASS